MFYNHPFSNTRMWACPACYQMYYSDQDNSTTTEDYSPIRQDMGMSQPEIAQITPAQQQMHTQQAPMPPFPVMPPPYEQPTFTPPPTSTPPGQTPAPTPTPMPTPTQPEQAPEVPIMSTEYTQGYLATQIGRKVKVDFLIGTNGYQDRSGTLLHVGISYIILREAETDDLLLCDLYSIKFVRFYY